MGWGNSGGSNSQYLKVEDFKIPHDQGGGFRKMTLTISDWEMKTFRAQKDGESDQVKLVLYFLNPKTGDHWEKCLTVGPQNLGRLGMITGIDISRNADEKIEAPKLIGWSIQLYIDKATYMGKLVDSITINTGFDNVKPLDNPLYEVVKKIGVKQPEGKGQLAVSASDIPF
jgi:hypothetical protein